MVLTALPALAQDPQILVFSRTAAFRHDSIPDGIAALRQLGQEHGFAVDASEDPGLFTDENLAVYRAVVFLSTTGDILTRPQEEAFERYIQAGGGFVGIHSASDTEYGWPWYGRLVGAYFADHPQIQTAQIRVIDAAHPSTRDLPRRWQRRDEWYNYQDNPRGQVHVLATLDESSYAGGSQGHDHPIAWCRDFDGGRSWYTGGGHTRESYAEPLFRRHLLGGIQYAAGLAPGDCGASLEANFEQTVLDDDARNPIALAPAPDGRVFYIERQGTVKAYLPTNGQIATLGHLEVSTQQEDGLLGIALDPNFAANGWLYLFYSPAGDEPVQHVSRFTLDNDRLDLQSERVLLQIPTQREQCCHSGGALVFGPDGALYIAVGDNTNPFDSEGYTPIDQRPGRAFWDAQRTSANTQDLRGKILRIVPRDDGGYTIPPGNLFAAAADGRPEIYVMGVRNPFRMSIDPRRGWLYWGDVGPDAGKPDPGRGPAGLDEWNRTDRAGNYGWPYCIGDNRPYRAFDFATGTAGPAFDCAAPSNRSPNNSGLQALPRAQPAWIWYPYGLSDEFPSLADGEGRTAMAGPVYYHDEDASPTALPAYYDGVLFIYEWARSWLHAVHLDEAGDLLQIDPFLPGLDLRRPIDLKLGPDGALYLLEWGDGFWGDNDNARLVRLQYARGLRAPVARGDALPTDGPAPLTVAFDASASFDPDLGSALQYAWDFDGDGTIDSRRRQDSFTYGASGDYTALLTVTDSSGRQGTDPIAVTVGKTRSQVRILAPPEGGFFTWGESVAYTVAATDAEDDPVDCAQIVTQAFIGHDAHSHPLDEFTGCQGRFTTLDGHGALADDLFYTVEVRYTDQGAPGVSALTGRSGIVLQPKRLEAEHYTRQQGVLFQATDDVLGGGQNAGWIEHGDYLSFAPVNLSGIDSLSFRVASAGSGGRIEVRLDATDGPLVASVAVPVTGHWQDYIYVGTPIEDPGGTHELFLVFKRLPGTASLFNVNWIDFHGPGVSAPPQTAVLEDTATLPTLPALAAAYPNPSNGSVVLGFTLPAAGRARLEIFDVLGQKVATLTDAPYAAGPQTLHYDTASLASGLYFYRLTALGHTASRRLAVIK